MTVTGTRDRHEFTEGLFLGTSILGWMMIIAPLLHLGTKLFQIQDSAQALRESLSLSATATTLVVCCIAVATSLLLALPVAFLLSRTDLPARRAAWACLLLFACTPLYVITTGWIRYFSLAWLIGPTHNWRPIVAAGLLMGFAYAPLAAAWISAGLLSVEREVEESGLLVTGTMRVALRMTLPLAGWSITGAALMVAILTAGEITVTDALGVSTYAEQIYISFNLEMNEAKALLTVLPLMLLLIPCWLGLLPMLRRLLLVSSSGQAGDPLLFKTGGLRLPILLLLALIGALYFYAPLSLGSAAFSGVGIGLSRLLPLLFKTTVLGIAGALLSVFLAVSMATLLYFSVNRIIRYAGWSIIVILLVIPAPLAGIALKVFWNAGFWLSGGMEVVPQLVVDTPIIVVLLYAMRTVSISTVLLWSGFRQIPCNLIEAAKVDGATPPVILWMIMLPLSRRFLAAGGIIAFVLCLAEVGGIIVCIPPGLEVFAVRFATQIHFGVDLDLARLVFCPFLIGLLPTGLALVLMRKTSR